MSKIILFWVLEISSLIILFAANIHGYAGAVILGLNTLTIDFFWQWLRTRLARKSGTHKMLLGILGGMALRIISIYLFIRLGLWWLGNGQINSYVSVFTIILLTIPIWNIIFLYKFRSEGN